MISSLWLSKRMNASNREPAYSRKNFLREIFCQCFRLLARGIALKDSTSREQRAEWFLDYLVMASDLSPPLVRQEALRLGLDPESIGREQLLQTVYKAMEKQHEAIEHESGNPS